MISYGVIPVSLKGILRKSTLAPLFDSSTSSEIQQVNPPPPKSLTPLTLISSKISSEASKTLFLVNGSATCTAGLSSVSLSEVNSSDANVTPWIPSRPVVPPINKKTSPTYGAFPRTILSFSTSPTHITLTKGFVLNESSNSTSPATVGTPTLLP